MWLKMELGMWLGMWLGMGAGLGDGRWRVWTSEWEGEGTEGCLGRSLRRVRGWTRLGVMEGEYECEGVGVGVGECIGRGGNGMCLGVLGVLEVVKRF